MVDFNSKAIVSAYKQAETLNVRDEGKYPYEFDDKQGTSRAETAATIFGVDKNGTEFKPKLTNGDGTLSNKEIQSADIFYDDGTLFHAKHSFNQHFQKMDEMVNNPQYSFKPGDNPTNVAMQCIQTLRPDITGQEKETLAAELAQDITKLAGGDASKIQQGQEVNLKGVINKLLK